MFRNSHWGGVKRPSDVEWVKCGSRNTVLVLSLSFISGAIAVPQAYLHRAFYWMVIHSI